ncbi:MAG: hydroxyacid dehydrogenase [Planctomycetes bacterium]|nr:hydroxyacid dehydrogenase [Planctomycetota bacterium]
MNTLLFLQKLGIEHDVIPQLIREARLPLNPAWGNWRDVDSPEDVFGIVTVQATVNDEILDHFPNVKVIAVAFTGYDCLDLDACRRRGIAAYNVPGYSTDSVAELTLALAISLLRDIPAADRQMRSGGWRLGSHGIELAGKTVGILGTGAIGRRAAELFKACRCKLIGWSRTERKEFADLGGQYLPLPEVLAGADIISLHLPLGPQTEGIISADELALMKPGAVLINTARGKLVDKAALIQALEEQRIRAALDVFDEEPLPPGDPIRKLPGTLLTPHLAFQTREALLRRARITIQNIKSFMDGGDNNRVA